MPEEKETGFTHVCRKGNGREFTSICKKNCRCKEALADNFRKIPSIPLDFEGSVSFSLRTKKDSSFKSRHAKRDFIRKSEYMESGEILMEFCAVGRGE